MQFLACSRLLTGLSLEDEDLAERYSRRLREDEKRSQALDELLRVAGEAATQVDPENALLAALQGQPALIDVAHQVIFLWYTSALNLADKWLFGEPDEYFKSQLWRVIRAHPPALSGGYFGHWSYLPE
jgi:hypothetical protein